MRSLNIAATTVAVLAGASFAYAGTSVGVIKSINAAKDTITLKNGDTYAAPKTVKLSNFKVGEKVDVTYATLKGKMGKGEMEITSLKPAMKS